MTTHPSVGGYDLSAGFGSCRGRVGAGCTTAGYGRVSRTQRPHSVHATGLRRVLADLGRRCADLSNQVQLTSESANSGWAVWSHGGARLDFDSDRADPTDSEAINDIFTMNPDGSGIVKLTDSKGFSAEAVWSPDGSQIAFDSDLGHYPEKQGIYVMDADGSNVRRVTELPKKAEFDLGPRFSPDGQHLTNITDNHRRGGSADPVWSPDGQKILFLSASGSWSLPRKRGCNLGC